MHSNFKCHKDTDYTQIIKRIKKMVAKYYKNNFVVYFKEIPTFFNKFFEIKYCSVTKNIFYLLTLKHFSLTRKLNYLLSLI